MRLVLFCLATLLLAAPASALTLRVCNSGIDEFAVAIRGSNGWGGHYVAGWYRVTAGRCYSKSGFEPDYHFTIAYEDRSGAIGVLPSAPEEGAFRRDVFQSSNRSFCVRNEAFDRRGSMSALASCGPGEALAPFPMFTTGLDLDTHTLNVTVDHDIPHRPAQIVFPAPAPLPAGPSPACAAGTAEDCLNAARALLPDDVADRNRAGSYQAGLDMLRGCTLGHAQSCYDLGYVVHHSVLTAPDVAGFRDALDPVCQAGQIPGACMAAAETENRLRMIGGDTSRSPEAQMYYAYACFQKHALGCLRAARIAHETTGMMGGPDAAYQFYGYACALAPEGATIPDDRPALNGCYALAEMAVKGEGLEAPDTEAARAAFSKVCAADGHRRQDTACAALDQLDG